MHELFIAMSWTYAHVCMSLDPVQVVYQFFLLWSEGAREAKYQRQPQCNSVCYKHRCLWRRWGTYVQYVVATDSEFHQHFALSSLRDLGLQLVDYTEKGLMVLSARVAQWFKHIIDHGPGNRFWLTTTFFPFFSSPLLPLELYWRINSSSKMFAYFTSILSFTERTCSTILSRKCKAHCSQSTKVVPVSTVVCCYQWSCEECK